MPHRTMDSLCQLLLLPVLVVLALLCVNQGFGQDARPSLALGVCERPWRKVLATDGGGNVTSGDLEELRSLALDANVFRVMLSLPEGETFINIDNLNVREGHVCGESLWHVTDNGTHVSTSAEWKFMLLCSTGMLHVIFSPYSRPAGWSLSSTAAPQERYLDAQNNYGDYTNLSVPMDWYVKEIGCRQRAVYSHYLDGSRVGGSLQDLLFLSQIGDVYVVMRDRGYTFRLNNVKTDELAREVNGQSVLHVGQVFSEEALDFKLPPYYWYSSWTTTGKRDNSRWFVGTTQPRGHNHDYVALDWHVDTCWRTVYANDQYGDPMDGSMDELTLMISLGHRVRVFYDGFNLEANFIRVTDNAVIAQSTEEMARRDTDAYDKYFFNTDTMWKWTTVHTSGVVRTVLVSVRTGAVVRRFEEQKDVRWMVDTRPWKRVLSTNSLGEVTRGSLPDLYRAVVAGASVRFNVQQDVSAGFLFTNADNVRVDAVAGVVYAQCLRHISDNRKPGSTNEYQIQDTPFYWFLMISSQGAMTMSAWKVQQRVQLYDSVAPEANITWFASL